MSLGMVLEYAILKSMSLDGFNLYFFLLPPPNTEQQDARCIAFSKKIKVGFAVVVVCGYWLFLMSYMCGC